MRSNFIIILKYSFLLLISIIFSCKNEPKALEKSDNDTEIINEPNEAIPETKVDTIDDSEPTQVTDNKQNTSIPPSWIELTEDQGFVLDIRYATTNNFTKKQIYDCGKCFVRPEAAKRLVVIQQELKEKFGYGIKLFDCYRPRPYQQRLWDIVPNPDYVTPPNKGSMHSRGLAVDLTLVDKNGKELDMGTAFDFFGEEAHQGYPGHSDAVKRHRWILKSTMEKHGFGSIRTEWWHYSYKDASAPLDTWVWDCP